MDCCDDDDDDETKVDGNEDLLSKSGNFPLTLVALVLLWQLGKFIELDCSFPHQDSHQDSRGEGILHIASSCSLFTSLRAGHWPAASPASPAFPTTLVGMFGSHAQFPWHRWHRFNG